MAVTTKTMNWIIAILVFLTIGGIVATGVLASMVATTKTACRLDVEVIKGTMNKQVTEQAQQFQEQQTQMKAEHAKQIEETKQETTRLVQRKNEQQGGIHEWCSQMSVVQSMMSEFPSKIIDAVLLYNEVDMLAARIRLLDPYVDYFVIVESEVSFAGHNHELHFSQVLDLLTEAQIAKTIYYVVKSDEFKNVQADKPNAAWDREKIQRDAIALALDSITGLSVTDIVFISDVDEIWNPEMLPMIHKTLMDCPNRFVRLCQQMYYYNLHWLFERQWERSIACLFGFLEKPGPEQLYSPEEIRRYSTNGLPIHYAGWHLSYFMTPEKIAEKINNFSHQELNTDEFKSVHHSRKAIQKGLDLYDRDFRYFYQKTCPEFLYDSPYGFDFTPRDEYERMCEQKPLMYLTRPAPITVRFVEPREKRHPVKQAVILITTCTEEPYQTIEREAVLATWAHPDLRRPEIPIIFYYGFPAGSDPQDHPAEVMLTSPDHLYIPLPENFQNMYQKTLLAMEWALKTYPDAEYILRSNISSYFNLDLWWKWLQTLPPSDEKVIAGPLVQNQKTFKILNHVIMSGCGYTVSRKLASVLVQNMNTPCREQHFLDDLQLSAQVRQMPCQWVLQPFYAFAVLDDDGPLVTDVDQIPVTIHYRCKRNDDRTQDVRNMKLVHQKLTGRVV